jgi:hypothetical protein
MRHSLAQDVQFAIRMLRRFLDGDPGKLCIRDEAATV